MSTLQTIRFGISTCPNDTFAFHGLLESKIDLHGLRLQIELMDVQELNERLAAGEFEAAKASFHAALHLAGDLGVLPVGAALGFGVGPLLLAAREGSYPSLPTKSGEAPVVLCPGAWTTATLLYRLFHSGGDVRQTVFDQIMPALKAGRADFGVCIHEGRFTYQAEGLHLVEDLGARWEESTDAPLPLGGLLARHSLGVDVHAALTAAIRSSIDYAWAHRTETLTTMRRYAQELDDDVIGRHVELYVNPWTRDLGEVGRRALLELRRRAVKAGLVRGDGPQLRVLGD